MLKLMETAMDHVVTGVFWLLPVDNETKIFGVIEPQGLDNCSSGGSLDSRYEHWHIWEQQPQLANLPTYVLSDEYFAYPRGRVLFDLNRRRHRIFCDKLLLQSEIKTSIKSFFGLQRQPVLWSSDPHYTTNPVDLDQLWSE